MELSSKTQKQLVEADGNKSDKEMKCRRFTSALLLNLRRLLDLFPSAPTARWSPRSDLTFGWSEVNKLILSFRNPQGGEKDGIWNVQSIN